MRRDMRTQRTPVASSRERLRDAAKTLFSEKGYEDTSTAAICRLAGTSQSQLIKHFTNKQGVLEAIFEYGWEQINPAVHLAIEKILSPKDKLKILSDMMLSFLDKDRQLRTLFLLEGRRIRGDGHMVVLTPGYLEFVKTLESILKEMAAKGELSPGINPQALRSAMMGTIEGLLRDQLLSKPNRFPASYSEKEARLVFSRFLDSCLTKS